MSNGIEIRAFKTVEEFNHFIGNLTRALELENDE